MTCTNQAVVSAHSWTHWEKLIFDQSFFSKYQIFSFENFYLGKKRGSEVVGIFRKFLEWGAETTFSNQSKTQATCNMAVINTNQWVSMGKRYDCLMSLHCSMLPHLMVPIFFLKSPLWNDTNFISYHLPQPSNCLLTFSVHLV